MNAPNSPSVTFMSPEQFADKVLEAMKAKQASGPEPLDPPDAEPVPVKPGLPWYKDRTFLASLFALITAISTTIGAWLAQSSAVDARREGSANAEQLKRVRVDVKNAAAVLGVPSKQDE